MGIGIAIAAIAIAATVASDIGFSVEEHKKQDELHADMRSAQAAINNTNDFYENVYKIVKTRLEHLNQSLRKLPSKVVHKLNPQLQVNLNDNPDNVIKGVGMALGISGSVVGVVTLVTEGLTRAGIAAADGIVAEIGAVAGAAGAVLAVAGFGLSLYNGITALNELNDAIDKVNAKRQKAENTMSRMKTSLDGLLSKMNLQVGSYDTLKNISDDWAQLAANFDTYSIAFYSAMTGYAMGKSEAQVIDHLKQRGCPTLKDDVLALAKLIEGDILQMMRDGKTDEEIINFFAKEHPDEGLRFVMDSFFVSRLRSFA